MDHDKIINLLRKHHLKLLVVFGLLCSLGVFIERKTKAKSLHAKKEYLVAKQIFERVQKGEPLSVESLDSAKKILTHHPELQAKYSTLMTYSLLHQEKVAEALSYATPSFGRVDNAPYTDYGKTALLIAQEDYPEAFVQADALETKLLANDDCPTLRAFNLLRLVFLSEELKNSERKEHYWQVLQKLPSFPELDQLFQEGKISLVNYLSIDS